MLGARVDLPCLGEEREVHRRLADCDFGRYRGERGGKEGAEVVCSGLEEVLQLMLLGEARAALGVDGLYNKEKEKEGHF